MEEIRFLYVTAAVGWALHLVIWFITYFHGFRTNKIDGKELVERFYRDYVISIGALIILCLVGVVRTL